MPQTEQKHKKQKRQAPEEGPDHVCANGRTRSEQEGRQARTKNAPATLPVAPIEGEDEQQHIGQERGHHDGHERVLQKSEHRIGKDRG